MAKRKKIRKVPARKIPSKTNHNPLYLLASVLVVVIILLAALMLITSVTVLPNLVKTGQPAIQGNFVPRESTPGACIDGDARLGPLSIFSGAGINHNGIGSPDTVGIGGGSGETSQILGGSGERIEINEQTCVGREPGFFRAVCPYGVEFNDDGDAYCLIKPLGEIARIPDFRDSPPRPGETGKEQWRLSKDTGNFEIEGNDGTVETIGKGLNLAGTESFQITCTSAGTAGQLDIFPKSASFLGGTTITVTEVGSTSFASRGFRTGPVGVDLYGLSETQKVPALNGFYQQPVPGVSPGVLTFDIPYMDPSIHAGAIQWDIFASGAITVSSTFDDALVITPGATVFYAGGGSGSASPVIPRPGAPFPAFNTFLYKVYPDVPGAPIYSLTGPSVPPTAVPLRYAPYFGGNIALNVNALTSARFMSPYSPFAASPLPADGCTNNILSVDITRRFRPGQVSFQTFTSTSPEAIQSEGHPPTALYHFTNKLDVQIT